ncbi:unnamed protein product [Rotaria magnacalcarata]|uniref:Sodium-coupled monocarboxylate transporter 1 n=1 Tax=Rotaria magnacalcarata TaxID=392030 RepID=A0A8S2QC13_9BILA|nr:unnamed protein product [Rotaria magnacalcarata]
MALPTLSVVDYILLILLLLSSAIIGAVFGFIKSKKSSAKEFLLADGGMGVFPTALSIMVSFLSAITLLGTPSEVYMYGTMYLYQAISWIIASTLTALVFMPKFRELNCTSAYEYLEKRFDRSVRMCASFAFSFFMLIYMAIVLYAPALALSQSKLFIQYQIRKRQIVTILATGLNIWISVVSIGVICTFYSSVKTILYNIFNLIKLCVSLDPRVRHTVWSLLIGGSFNALSTYGFNQTQVQRYMCVRTTRGAKQALFINAFGATIIIWLSGIIGLILYAYYAECDPFTAKYVTDIDQIFPYFVMEVLSGIKGLPGIFLACVFSGSLSTISSGLNSLAAVIIEDVYKGLMGKTLTDERQGLASKIFSIVLGAVVMLLTYVVSYLGSILNAALSLFGVLSGPVMGAFFLGFFFPQANSRGGFIGFIASLLLQLWIFLGAQITKNQMKSERLPLSVANCPTLVNITTTLTTSTRSNPLIDFYSISYMWYTPIAVGTVVIVGLIVSYITGSQKPNEIDPKLLISVSDLCCCCLPKRMRDWFRCGIIENGYFEKKAENDIELPISEEFDKVRNSFCSQTFSTDTKDTFPSDIVIENVVEKGHDNPAMTMKD